MSFDKLMAELQQAATDQDTLAKALPTDDGKDDEAIQAAAGEGDEAGKSGDAADADDKSGGDDKPMAKSFEVTLADGTKVQAEDGTELVKSLTARLDKSEADMAKVAGAVVALVKGQAALIKSLGDQVTKLSNAGRGRKTVVTVTEKKDGGEPLAKSDGAGMTVETFLAKSQSAFDAKKITGVELTTIDVAARMGVPVDPGLISKVLSA